MLYMKVVLQDGIKDCGVCCLISIMKYYGGDISKEYLRELTCTTKNGVTAYNLIKAGEKIGFNSFALKGEIEQINLSNLPCIAHVIINKTYQHFIVIYEIDFKNKKVLIMDPAKGKCILSLSEFKLMSSNNYIFFVPNKKLPLLMKNKIIKDLVLDSYNHNKKNILLILYLTISYFLFHILSVFHFKYLIDFAINYKISENVKLISILVLIIFILKEFSSYFRNILLLKYSSVLDYEITTKIYKQIILLPYLYYKNRTTGEILSRLKDLTVIKNYLLSFFITCSTDIISCLIFIILLFNINLELTLISICLFIILIIYNLAFRKKLNKYIRSYYRKEEKLNSYLIESLSSVDVIKGMHTEKITLDKLKIKYKKYLGSIYNLSFFKETFSFIEKNINNIFQILIFGFGSVLVIKEKINLGQLVVYQSVLSFLNQSINNIVNLIHEYPNYKIAKERIEDLFNIKEETFLGGSYYSNILLNGKVIYKNLSYSYNNKKILDNINITLNFKDKIFLYGPSGTGKSTFVKLLMRYIEVPFGYITINDIDINHYHLDVLRNRITYVSQQEFLFTDSIYNNITLYKDYHKEQIEQVLKITLVDEFIGNDSISYNQLVEENGFNFSGGERQRIILARSILKESDIYIFDEALSQIDIERERKILKNIFKYLNNKIIIVISHRNDNKDLFNRVLELKDGKLNERKLRKK